MGLIGELKRRNVFKVAVAYMIVGWVVLQVAETARHLAIQAHSKPSSNAKGELT